MLDLMFWGSGVECFYPHSLKWSKEYLPWDTKISTLLSYYENKKFFRHDRSSLQYIRRSEKFTFRWRCANFGILVSTQFGSKYNQTIMVGTEVIQQKKTKKHWRYLGLLPKRMWKHSLRESLGLIPHRTRAKSIKFSYELHTLMFCTFCNNKENVCKNFFFN